MRNLLVLFLVFYAVNSTCRSGYDLVRNGECRGKYTTVSVYYDASTNPAIANCNNVKGQPIIIHDAMDQSYWTSQATGNMAVLGLVCNSTTKQWTWSDGSVMDFKPASYTSDLDADCKSLQWFIRSDGSWYAYNYHSTINTDVFCSIAAEPLPVPNPNGCESFEDDSEDAICYQVAVTAENFRDAQMVCKNVGAEVASIHNERENSFVRRLAVSRGAVNGVFVGALSGNGKDFVWTDGSAWDYDHFYPGFPIAGLGQCLVLDTQGTTGEWMNVDCNKAASVACMRQQNFTSSISVCPTEPPKEGSFIFSPGFPFDASLPCDYILMVEDGKKVQVEILMLEANSCCDRLIIYEDYFAGKVIANLTGESKDRVYTTTSSNFMKVSWQPNGGVNVRGAMMTFRGV